MALSDAIQKIIDKYGEPPRGKSTKFEYHPNVFAVLGRRTDGTYHAAREWYVEETYDDDDLSRGGFKIPSRPGSARRGQEWTADSLDEIMTALDSPAPVMP